MSHLPSFPFLAKGLFVAAALMLFLLPQPSLAQKEPVRLIRDTEIEAVLKEWALPVIRAGGLDPEAIRFILVQSNDTNAFVAGGQNIFIFTGLLQKSENPGEVIGVIAHELGHISGGHLISTQGALSNSSYESILGTILGIGAAVLTGNGDVGMAVATGAQSAAMSRFLAFSRVQESSADQAALTGLEKAGLSADGLVSFLKKMEADELLPASQQAAWIRTHPLTHDRVEAVQARAGNAGKPLPPEWQEQHDRIMAKLKAFITPERVAWDYDDRDHSTSADYARTIAAYRQNRVDEALRRMEDLLQREPDNPFFLELKGQILSEFGKVEEALPAYRRSLTLYSDAPLVRVPFANALIETAAKDTGRLDEAIQQLDRASRDEPRMPRIYRLLATAYGRKGDESLAKLYLAEEAYLNRNFDYAKKQAGAALAAVKKGSPAALRAQEILSRIEKEAKKD